MKKNHIDVVLFTILALYLNLNELFGQETRTFNYQAVIRDVNSELLQNQNIRILSSIVKGSQIGAIVYTESHLITTNNFGVANLKIGEGDIVSGIFNDIDISCMRNSLFKYAFSFCI